MRRALGSCLLALSSLSLQLGACGGDAKVPKTVEEREDQKAERLLERARERKSEVEYRKILERFPATRAAKEAADQLAMLLVEQAEASLAGGQYDEAEARSEEARKLGGLAATERARKVLDAVDDHRAERTASEANQLAASGRCASGLELVGRSLARKPRDRYRKAVLAQSQAALVSCLIARIEAEVAQGNPEAARALLEGKEATDGLSAEAYREVDKALQKLMVRASLGSVKPFLDRRDWVGAFARLDAMKEANELTEREHAAAVEVVQDAVKDHLLVAAVAARTEKSPIAARKKLEEQIRVARWQSPPEAVMALLDVLAVAEECERVGCKMARRATPAWAWGTLEVRAPKSAEQGTKVETIAHARRFWVLGRGKAHALVSLEDPGTYTAAEAFTRGIGWVRTERLRTTDTFLWLPPPDQAVGFRVWGPLRPPGKDFHLGTVTRVEGDRATVKRMADSEEVTVAWKDLRAGRLPRGLKVLAFCIDELHPEEATVDTVEVEGEPPKVKVSCTKGNKTRVEVGSALVSREGWLHPHQP